MCCSTHGLIVILINKDSKAVTGTVREEETSASCQKQNLAVSSPVFSAIDGSGSKVILVTLALLRGVEH